MKKKGVMVSLVVLALRIVFTVNSALAAGCIEDKVVFGEDEILHKMSIFVSGQFEGSQFGWSAFFLSHKYWSEGYVGPSWAPAPWLCLSVSVGVQSVESGNPVKFAGSAWVGNLAGSVLALYERGSKASNDWWKVVPLVALPHGIKAGAILEKGLDIAPIVEVAIPKASLSIWGAYYKDASQLGLKFKF